MNAACIRSFRPGRRSAVLISILGAALLAGCESRPTPPAALQSVSGITLGTAHLETVPREIEAPGTVLAGRTAEVAAQTMGTVEQILVREGDSVQQGQLLARLDERELAARRNAAQAALEQAAAAEKEAEQGEAAAQAQAEAAAKTYQRFVYLRDQKSVAPQEFDEVEARHRAADAAFGAAQQRRRQAEAALARAEWELRAAATAAGYARIVAPFRGVVARRMIEPGSMATPGVPLFIVEDSSRYQLRATLDASFGAAVRRGAPLRVQLDALPGKIWEGKVAEVEGGADALSHTIGIRIDLPTDLGVRSGLFGRAWFRTGDRRALIVPRGAVSERGQLTGMYVLDQGGVLHWRLVTTGARSDKGAEILSGLEEGERFVLDPGARDLDGKQAKGER